MRGVGVAVITT